MATSLENQYKDSIGLTAKPSGDWASNKVLISIPGSGLDPIELDGNNWTESGKAAQRLILEKYIRKATQNMNKQLAAKLNWEADKSKGVTPAPDGTTPAPDDTTPTDASQFND